MFDDLVFPTGLFGCESLCALRLGLLIKLDFSPGWGWGWARVKELHQVSGAHHRDRTHDPRVKCALLIELEPRFYEGKSERA